MEASPLAVPTHKLVAEARAHEMVPVSCPSIQELRRDYPVLFRKEDGIFLDVSDDVLEKVLGHPTPHQTCWAVGEGYSLFRQGQPARTLSVWVVLSGAFEVRHEYERSTPSQRVAINRSGHLLADVEALVKECEFKIPVRNLSAKVALSTVRCIEPGLVLQIDPPEALFQPRDFQLMMNYARLLARQIIDRHGNIDKSRGAEKLREYLLEVGRSSDLVIIPATPGFPEMVEIQTGCVHLTELEDVIGKSRGSLWALLNQNRGFRFDNGLVRVPRLWWSKGHAEWKRKEEESEGG